LIGKGKSGDLYYIDGDRKETVKIMEEEESDQWTKSIQIWKCFLRMFKIVMKKLDN